MRGEKRSSRACRIAQRPQLGWGIDPIAIYLAPHPVFLRVREQDMRWAAQPRPHANYGCADPSSLRTDPDRADILTSPVVEEAPFEKLGRRPRGALIGTIELIC